MHDEGATVGCRLGIHVEGFVVGEGEGRSEDGSILGPTVVPLLGIDIMGTGDRLTDGGVVTMTGAKLPNELFDFDGWPLGCLEG